MHVVFIHGPPASGKHTIGSLLSARIGLPLFHNHLAVDVAKVLFDFGSPAFRQLRASIWRSTFAAAAAADRSFIFTFNPEATVEPELIRELVGSVVAAGGNVHFFELRCSRATVLQRLGNESRTKFGKLTDRDLYEQIDRSGGFAFPPLPTPVLVINTESVTPDHAALQIEQALTGRLQA